MIKQCEIGGFRLVASGAGTVEESTINKNPRLFSETGALISYSFWKPVNLLALLVYHLSRPLSTGHCLRR